MAEKKKKIREKELINKMVSLIREHGNPESIQELYLYISSYAPRITPEENEFCKSYLRHRVAAGLDRDYT